MLIVAEAKRAPLDQLDLRIEPFHPPIRAPRHKVIQDRLPPPLHEVGHLLERLEAALPRRLDPPAQPLCPPGPACWPRSPGWPPLRRAAVSAPSARVPPPVAAPRPAAPATPPAL